MIEPVFEDGKWWIEKDPEDKLFYTADVTEDLAVMNTTAVSVLPVVEGVEALTEVTISAGKLTVKLGGLAVTAGAVNKCTFRVTCANTEQFDRTIHFKRVDN
jgi:hypothetical protein